MNRNSKNAPSNHAPSTAAPTPARIISVSTSTCFARIALTAARSGKIAAATRATTYSAIVTTDGTVLAASFSSEKPTAEQHTGTDRERHLQPRRETAAVRVHRAGMAVLGHLELVAELATALAIASRFVTCASNSTTRRSAAYATFAVTTPGISQISASSGAALSADSSPRTNHVMCSKRSVHSAPLRRREIDQLGRRDRVGVVDADLGAAGSRRTCTFVTARCASSAFSKSIEDADFVGLLGQQIVQHELDCGAAALRRAVLRWPRRAASWDRGGGDRVRTAVIVVIMAAA